MNPKELSKQIITKSELFADVMSACSTLLKHHPIAESTRKYLNQRCSDFYQKEFNFGYFPKSSELHHLLAILDDGETKLSELGLLYKKEAMSDGIFLKENALQLENHNLILPYKNLYGDIIAVVGRTLLPKEKQINISKYKNTNFKKKNHLFGLNKSKKSILEKNAIFIVEGQFDFISCYRHGFQNTVAVGSANLSKNQFYIIKRYTNNLYFLFDNDEAGNKGFEKAKSKYSNFANIQKINLPIEYKDIDEYLNNSSSHDILEL
jgi:DNA primase catalytic core